MFSFNENLDRAPKYIKFIEGMIFELLRFSS